MTEQEREEFKNNLIDAYKKYHYKDSQFVIEYSGYLSAYIDNPFYLQLQEDFENDPVVNFKITSEWFRNLFSTHRSLSARYRDKVKMYIEVANDKVATNNNQNLSFKKIDSSKTQGSPLKENLTNTYQPTNFAESEKTSGHTNINSEKFKTSVKSRNFPKKLTTVPRINEGQISGFTKDIAQLKKMFFEKQQSVVVKGIRGTGKTTLISSYVLNHFEDYDYFLYIDIENVNLKNAFENNKELRRSLNLNKELNDSEDIFDEIIYTLKHLKGSKKLLIIENADESILDYLNILPSLPDWHLLISSHKDLKPLVTFNISPIYGSDASRVFKFFCQYDIEPKVIEETIIYFGGHPKLIKIIAGLISSGAIKETHLEKLLVRKKTIELITIFRNSHEVKNVIDQQATIFDLQILSKDLSTTIFYFACLPLGQYKTSSFNKFYEGSKNRQSSSYRKFSELVSKGYLKYSRLNDTFYIEPVVKQFVLQYAENKEQEFEAFVNTIVEEIELTKLAKKDQFHFYSYRIIIEQLIEMRNRNYFETSDGLLFTFLSGELALAYIKFNSALSCINIGNTVVGFTDFRDKDQQFHTFRITLLLFIRLFKDGQIQEAKLFFDIAFENCTKNPEIISRTDILIVAVSVISFIEHLDLAEKELIYIQLIQSIINDKKTKEEKNIYLKIKNLFIGALAIRNKEYRIAVEVLEKGLKTNIDDTELNQIYMLVIYQLIAIPLIHLKKWDGVIFYNQKTIDIIDSQKEIYSIKSFDCELCIIECYLQQGKIEEANKKAISLNNICKDNEMLSTSRSHHLHKILGEILYKQNKINEAAKYLILTTRIFEKEKSTAHEKYKDAKVLLSKINKKLSTNL